jgi:hypothetical protein
MWHGDVLHRFTVANRLLLHWQQVAAVGLPEHWTSLSFSDESVPTLLARIEAARVKFGGTEHMFELDRLAADLRAPKETGIPVMATDVDDPGDGVEKTPIEMVVTADGAAHGELSEDEATVD